MSEQLYRQKTFMSVSKLIDGLKPEERPDGLEPRSGEEPTKIRIVFNDVFRSKGKYTGEMNVRILTVKAMRGFAVLKNYDMLEIFKIANGINVWLNVRKQLNKTNFGLTKKLHCLDIDLDQKKFINQKGETISYYPIQYINVKEGDENIRVMNRLEKELEEKEVEYVNSLGTKSVEAHEEVEEEIDPDTF